MKTMHYSSELTLGEDGYVRLTFQDLLTADMQHISSDIYINTNRYSNATDCSEGIEGYTEWISRGSPGISIGWDWSFTYNNKRPVYTITGKPFSNLQLVDKNLNDIEFEENLYLIKSYACMLDWERIVDGCIRSKYC